MFCTNCGTQIPDGSSFCTNCGTKVAAEQMPVVEAAPIAETAPIAEIVPPVNEDEDSKTIALMPDDTMFGAQAGPAMENEQVPDEGQQIPYSNPQMNPQMNPQVSQQMGMGYENPQMGMPYVNPQMGMPYGQPMNGMSYAPVAPKKKFVMPLAVNIILGVLAVAAVAVLVLVIVLGKPKAPELSANEVQASTITENPRDNQNEVLTADLSGNAFSLEIPETEAYLDAQEKANGYVIADSNSRYLEYDELWDYSEDELFTAYLEIYARAGVDMAEVDESVAELFEGKSWYNPTISLYDESITELSDFMNEYEIANLATIEQFMIDVYGYETVEETMEE